MGLDKNRDPRASPPPSVTYLLGQEHCLVSVSEAPELNNDKQVEIHLLRCKKWKTLSVVKGA